MANEFAIIDQYFTAIGQPAVSTILGIGDDAAVVEVPAGQQLVVSMDTLIAGTHFPADTSPEDIAYKSLAVNLSDLAAMGASPAWFLLSLTLEDSKSGWLSKFATGLRETADAFGLQLIGGDTCRGKLAISIQIAGHVPRNRFVTRHGASVGDIILVSGELGNAALGLAQKQGKVDLPSALQAECALALNRPQPRLELAPFLREFATSAVDVSDGLVGDLRHLLDASNCGARIERVALPVNAWIVEHNRYDYALDAGDDYQICCTVAADNRAEIDRWNRDHPNCRLTAIGEIIESGYSMSDGKGLVDLGKRQGYRHFD
jgi:thiamine-monophosphate kinase